MSIFFLYLCLHILGLCYGMYRPLLYMDQAQYAKTRDCMEAHIQVCENHPADAHFPHHHDLTRHHRKTILLYWPARHLH